MSNILEQCPVPILQSPWEFEQLLGIYKKRSPRKIVEIGSFYGGTLWYWLHSVMKIRVKDIHPNDLHNVLSNKVHWNIEKLTCIDYPIGPSDGRHDEMLRCRAMWPEWTKDLDFHDIQGDSHDINIIQRVKALYPDNDVDFLFIDGDHSYEGVKADYENYRSLVHPGGFIVFHDVCGLPEVKQFWDEIKPQTKSIEINEPNGWGIGIIEI